MKYHLYTFSRKELLNQTFSCVEDFGKFFLQQSLQICLVKGHIWLLVYKVRKNLCGVNKEMRFLAQEMLGSQKEGMWNWGKNTIFQPSSVIAKRL
jgi:hypothetical protein